MHQYEASTETGNKRPNNGLQSRAYPHVQWASDFNDQFCFRLKTDSTYLYNGLHLASAEPQTYLSALCAFGLSSLMKDRELSTLDCNQDIGPSSSDLRPRLLNIASYQGHGQIVEMLLGRGFRVNAQADNMSALHVASQECHESVMRTLLDHGAHVDLQNKNREAALVLASYNGLVSIAKTLLKKGADVNHVAHKRGNPLQIAARYDHPLIVQLLLRHGANVNAQSEETQQTALHLAYRNGHESIVQMLLEHGADVDARDDMPERFACSIFRWN